MCAHCKNCWCFLFLPAKLLPERSNLYGNSLESQIYLRKKKKRLKLFRKTLNSHCRRLNGTVHCVSSSIFSSLWKHLAWMHFRVRRFCYGLVPLYCGAEVLDCCQQAEGKFSCWNSGILKRPFQYSNSHMTLINIDAGWLCPLLATKHL